jgi:hypothetical protein
MLHPAFRSAGLGDNGIRWVVLIIALLCGLCCGSNYVLGSMSIPLSKYLDGRNVRFQISLSDSLVRNHSLMNRFVWILFLCF